MRLFTTAFQLGQHPRLLCVIFPPDAAVPVSLKGLRVAEWEEGKKRSHRQEREDRQTEKKRERQGRRELEEKAGEGDAGTEEGAHAYTQAGGG